MLQTVIRAQIEISADPESVWALITDFNSYPQWNASIPRLEGKPVHGGRLTVGLHLFRAARVNVRAQVLNVDPPRELRWVGKLWPPGLLAGEHVFLIERVQAGRVRFTQMELFSGILVPLFVWFLGREIQLGFESSNRELKHRVENVVNPH